MPPVSKADRCPPTFGKEHQNNLEALGDSNGVYGSQKRTIANDASHQGTSAARPRLLCLE